MKIITDNLRLTPLPAALHPRYIRPEVLSECFLLLKAQKKAMTAQNGSFNHERLPPFKTT